MAPPVSKPVPVQKEAFDEDHESVEDDPFGTLEGVAEKTTDGAGDGLTVTVADAVAEPDKPEQVIEYVVVDEGDTDTEPEVALPATVNPEPVQDCVFVEDQVSSEELPVYIDPGFALSVTDGAGP